jgi:hypothetical protein
MLPPFPTLSACYTNLKDLMLVITVSSFAVADQQHRVYAASILALKIQIMDDAAKFLINKLYK